MNVKQYQSLAGSVFAIGLVAWLVLRTGDPRAATLFRDALWVVAGGGAAYGTGLHRGEQRASANVGE